MENPKQKLMICGYPYFLEAPIFQLQNTRFFMSPTDPRPSTNLKRLGPIGLDLVSITTELLHCSGPFSLLGIGTEKKSTGKLKFF